MENQRRERAPFDQQAALEELERFGRDIERYRAQREALGDEFETFVRSFKTPPERAADRPPSGPLTRALPRGPPPPLPTAAVTAAPPPAGPIVPPATAVAASVPAPLPADIAPVAPAPAPRGRATFGMPAVAAGGLLAVLAAGWLVATLWNRDAGSAPPAADAVETPAAAPAPSAAPPPAAPAPAAPVVITSESAITTVRRVWMRVMVDGERVLEREVPAGTRVPLKAEKTIVIRTGDAGAVRLSMRGEDRGFLGPEGQVVTRSFTVPPRQTPAGR